MDGSAPKGIIQSASQPTRKLHEEVSGQLKKAGYPATAESVNPEDVSALQNIQDALGDSVRITGDELDRVLKGEGHETGTGVTSAGRLRRWVLNRFKRKVK